MEKKLLPKGTKVYDIRYGWGEIERHNENLRYEYDVFFTNQDTGSKFGYSYDSEGYVEKAYLTPLLSLTEYNLTNGGFTPITEFDFDKPQINDVGYF